MQEYLAALKAVGQGMAAMETADAGMLAAARDVQQACEDARKDQHNQMVSAQKRDAYIVCLGALLAVALAVLLTIFLTRAITRPIRHVAQSLTDGSSQVASAASQVSGASQQLAEGASEQAAALEETAASLEEIAP